MTRVFRSAYSPPVKVGLECKGPGLAKQAMKDSCDINLIMGRYLRSGNVDHLAKHSPMYGFASSQTFHEAMNVVRKAEEMFLDLPSELRKRFGNDPGNFLEFVQATNDKGELVNLEDMRKLGLAKPAVAPEPIPRVMVVDEAGKPIVAPAPAKPA